MRPRLLTENFHEAEFLVSREHSELLRGYQFSEQERQNLFLLCTFLLEPLRARVGGPLMILSGFRTPELNSLTPGASPDSQHLRGEAADFTHTNLEACWRYLVTERSWPGQIRWYRQRFFIHAALPRFNVAASRVIISDGEKVEL